MRKRSTKVAALAAFGMVTTLLAQVAGETAAHADGPGSGTPWVVSVGDSYISGEAGRWAGNTNTSYSNIDALGPTAYFDNPSRTSESIDRCHRSWSAEAFIGSGTNSLNLACSAALTRTSFDSEGRFKPGLDHYSDSAGRKGQALMLEEFARTHNVKVIPLSIGGNDFNFSGVVQACVQAFLTSPTWWQNHCSKDPNVTGNFSADRISARTAAIGQAILNVRQAMMNAGYHDGMYTIVVQDYLNPISSSAYYRYSESGYTRQATGGCGFWNVDADWMNGTALPAINNAVRQAVANVSWLPNVRFLELQGAFNGHGLCDNRVGLLEERGLGTWQSAGASDASEWVNQIRTVTTAGSSPYYMQESLHPNYWGQLALRNCLRQAYNSGAPLNGRCISGTGRNGAGEPNVWFHRQVTVPQVVGLSYTEAASRVTAAGLSPSHRSIPTCDEFTPSQVVNQGPNAGTKAYASDTVVLSVHTRGPIRLCYAD